MAIVDPRTWLEVLPEAECWRRLRLSEVGRLAVVIDREPTIWPVNIAVDGRTVVFRTGPGSKLAACRGGAPVALEVDGLDFDHARAWSVVVNGTVGELAGDALARARALGLQPWTVGEKAQWCGVRVARITGRAVGERAAARPS